MLAFARNSWLFKVRPFNGSGRVSIVCSSCAGIQKAEQHTWPKSTFMMTHSSSLFNPRPSIELEDGLDWSHRSLLNCHTRINYSTEHGGGNKYQKRKEVEPLTQKGSSEIVDTLRIDEKEWETVYRFQYIRVARVVQKLKIYQTIFTSCVVLPGSVGCSLYGLLPAEAISFSLASSFFACGMLYIMGRFCSRLIGVIYVSKKDPQLVRIAHLNFWGKRDDQIFAKSDFIPFSELPDKASDVYINASLYSEPETKLHLSVRYGTVYNKTQFLEIFGTQAGMDIHQTGQKHKE